MDCRRKTAGTATSSAERCLGEALVKLQFCRRLDIIKNRHGQELN